MDSTYRWFVSLKEGGSRVIIATPDRETLKYEVQLKFPATNNEAEYERILMGLRFERPSKLRTYKFRVIKS